MRFIVSPSTDVYYNLAAESHFLHHTAENLFLFWRSEKAVVCGKHQNLCAEINYAACHQLGIEAARRVSGGGTVYHDLGNLNFAFIQDLGTTLDKAVNYKRFLEPIRQALAAMGIESTYSERDDLLHKGLKFSGNAQHIFQQQKRVLHHGTLLFNAKIHHLGQALKTDGTYRDKAVKSNRSAVTNLSDHFPQLANMDQTITALTQSLIPLLMAVPSNITPQENKAIIALRNQKFHTDEWILGYSPTYEHSRSFTLENQTYHLTMVVTKGQITQFEIRNEAHQIQWQEACERVLNQPISHQTFERAFAETPLALTQHHLNFF
ncbi:MAG: lipoate--protein ligase family protein [Sphingomonadales bacterium]|nr:lipoate--protein ligase family protein [Sphingomonadales bacterium]